MDVSAEHRIIDKQKRIIPNQSIQSFNPFKLEFTIVIFIH